MTSLAQRGLEICRGRLRPGSSAAHQDHRVVGRHATVAVYPIKAATAGTQQLIMKQLLIDDSVGSEHPEHGGQAGCQHAGALGHAADGPALIGEARLLWYRVSCHDPPGSPLPPVVASH